MNFVLTAKYQAVLQMCRNTHDLYCWNDRLNLGQTAILAPTTVNVTIAVSTIRTSQQCFTAVVCALREMAAKILQFRNVKVYNSKVQLPLTVHNLVHGLKKNPHIRVKFINAADTINRTPPIWHTHSDFKWQHLVIQKISVDIAGSKRELFPTVCQNNYESLSILIIKPT